ncbi:nuclear transcription factor Y subunit B-5-like [Rhododendron vialii]|uniref:nuclear transcription factor Y subunit B-5-like n=1 Tax=Rhododendron vialii TaxID=182163 RepID=UPI00265DD832|nr:nuclear transcription factor Y subunit B-5-like [Rhododendron vialii]
MEDNIGLGAGGSGDEQAAAPHIKEQDRLLPIANVGRIMKQTLPPNAKISKEAKERMQECVSEFISFVTSEASDKCKRERRKTVNGDDVCWALANLGFDEYAGPLKRYLNKYREVEGDRGNNSNQVGEGYQRDDHVQELDQGNASTSRPNF